MPVAPHRHTALLDELVQAIRAGRYAAGARLPTHRAFARQHGVALATASKVYRELERRGLVVGETGRGTFVREWQADVERQSLTERRLEAAMPRPAPIDLAFNYPDTPGAGDLLDTALQVLREQGAMARLMEPQPVGGGLPERAAMARHLAQAGVAVPPEQVLLVGGAQQGLACAVMALLQPGDVVVVDELTYPGFTSLAQTQALELQPLRWTDGGPDLDHLERLLQQRPVKLVFAMPTLHNPTGWVMDLPSRERLAAFARAHKVWLLEDASYAFLASAAPPPLAALAPERTVYVSGLSKSVGGGVRLGYMALPAPLVARCERTLRAIAWSQPTLMSALGAHWLDTGMVRQLEQDKRLAARAKQQLALRCLAGLKLQSHPDSFFVWVRLPEAVRAEPLTVRLAERGIAVTPSSAFAVAASYPHAIRLNLGAASLEVLAQALPVVRETIEAMELA